MSLTRNKHTTMRKEHTKWTNKKKTLIIIIIINTSTDNLQGNSNKNKMIIGIMIIITEMRKIRLIVKI